MEKQSFSIDYKKIVNCLPNFIVVKNPNINIPKTYRAIWDTGAMKSAISFKIFDELKLDKGAEITVAGVNGASIVCLTAIDIVLENNIGFEDIDVTVCNLPKDIDALIGMDIITQGDLSVTNYEKTVLEFETPARRPYGRSEQCEGAKAGA